jgi:hypothetical protein
MTLRFSRYAQVLVQTGMIAFKSSHMLLLLLLLPPPRRIYMLLLQAAAHYCGKMHTRIIFN